MLHFIKPYQRKAKQLISNLLGLNIAQNSSTIATVSSQL
ncbi:Serpentine Receptor, class D (delta) [Caenorhabditis elegans]|nr:Serpentine Receptor, class D (delta) [Caenorhabditis elegans]NP_001303774.1 Serpentine Receptor, class D (delta) [Caenorhabditis elegans]CUR30014.1 Serpentine Receptor, class D (delta) [Caenorhabditis elegans]CUR30073.1 Serpentine Receptor, class D (delta) [Caenorhabditis elegans]|eukprot:NP_001303715.1 Serpentine Receptor, class D (delta) [Caenorhabditis elegans]